MIQTKNIFKSFGNVKVLKGIDVIIPDGKVVSIVGPSGAGKTTLLQILGTLSKPDSGEVFFNDKSISTLRERELAHFRNRHIGFVFQFHHLLPEFSALENVCMPGLIARKSKKETEKRALDLLEFLGLNHRISHKPSELSGGEQQRVAVARALINDPSVIFADEPSGNLDTKNKEELHQLFFSLRDTFNKTFVIVTHDMHLAENSDVLLRMHDGKMEI
jgi:lipoprotein-releasing system ATP-binding protein